MGERTLRTHVGHVIGSLTETSDDPDDDTPSSYLSPEGKHDNPSMRHDVDNINAPPFMLT